MLSYAVLSPNPHNKQPWKIYFTGENSFELHIDQSRLLPATDPVYRQIHIGQGTFLETLSIAATGLGYEADIHYFPDGMYSNNALPVTGTQPIASVILRRQEHPISDPLFKQLLNRRSNKRTYDNTPPSAQLINQIQSSQTINSAYPLSIVNQQPAKESMHHFLTRAMEIEVGNRQRDRETIEMFRFNDTEVSRHRDGFGLAQSGVTGIKRFAIETLFLSREDVEKDPTQFGAQAVAKADQAAASTATFAWLSSKSNTRLDQVKVGRAYCRLNLLTTAMGIAQHPMSQVLQEYPDMLALQKDFKRTFDIPTHETVQMLFRLGHATPTPHAPRRAVEDILSS